MTKIKLIQFPMEMTVLYGRWLKKITTLAVAITLILRIPIMRNFWTDIVCFLNGIIKGKHGFSLLDFRNKMTYTAMN